VSDPYSNIITGVGEEFAINFTTTTGMLNNLNGSVTYRIKVLAVAVYNGMKFMEINQLQ